MNGQIRHTAFFVVHLFFATAFLGTVPGTPLRAEEVAFSSIPYKIRVYIVDESNNLLEENVRSAFAETILQRCRLRMGNLWNLEVLFPKEVPVELEARFTDPPDDWENWDKIFLAVFNRDRNLVLREFDVKTRWVGSPGYFEIDLQEKSADVLLQGLIELFSPIAKMEKASLTTATFRVQGADILLPSDLYSGEGSEEPAGSTPTIVGIPYGSSSNPGVLLPFVRAYDRRGKLLEVTRVPWTALVAEEVDLMSNLLQCRIESGLRGALVSRRRGQTEVYALSIPTPLRSTRIRLRPRIEQEDVSAVSTLQTLSVYEVFESIPDERKLKRIGQTASDGSFLLRPDPDRPVRSCYVRSGRSLVAQFPVVRGLERELIVPVPDDPVRLDAEAALIGLQEEFIDVQARREILMLRRKRYEEKKDEKNAREVHNEISRLKDTDRFLLELEQLRLRYRSRDSVVQKRIDKMFGDTRAIFRRR